MAVKLDYEMEYLSVYSMVDSLASKMDFLLADCLAEKLVEAKDKKLADH